MYFKKVPKYIQRLYPQLLWSMQDTEQTLYLTFDDGPCSASTEDILDCLAEYNVQATFFCLGRHVESYPILFKKIQAEGHAIGNHGYEHLSGWKTNTDLYIENAQKADALIQSNIFRPPYGRIKRNQTNEIAKDFSIIMWDVMPGDFDASVTSDACIKTIKKYAGNGSIIVLHDNPKAYPKVIEILSQVIPYFQKQGFTFSKIDQSNSG